MNKTTILAIIGITLIIAALIAFNEVLGAVGMIITTIAFVADKEIRKSISLK